MERLPSNSNNYLPSKVEKSVSNIVGQLVMLPQVANALSMADKYIINALLKKKIKDYEGNEAAEKIAKMLYFIAIDIGASPKDEAEWKFKSVRIVQVICKYYGEMSIEDIKTAFEMLTIHELDDYMPSADRKHYGQFTAEYVVRVLNAYKQRQDASIAIAYENAPQKQETECTAEQNKEGEDFIRDVVMQWFENYKDNGTLPRNEIGYVSYHFIVVQVLEKSGHLTRITPTDEHRTKAYHEYMRQHSIKRVTDTDAAYVRKVGIKASALDYLAQKYADYEAIKTAFDTIINNGINIKDVT